MGIQQYYIDKKIKKALDKSSKAKTKTALSKIRKVAILVDETTSFNEKEFKALQKIIKLDATHFSILTYKQKNSSINKFNGVVVVENDINWKGKITSKNITEFINRSYDLLIDYTQTSNQKKQLIVSEINASFKVGFEEKNHELYDFMIRVNPSKIEVFNKEMVHYLSILKLV